MFCRLLKICFTSASFSCSFNNFSKLLQNYISNQVVIIILVVKFCVYQRKYFRLEKANVLWISGCVCVSYMYEKEWETKEKCHKIEKSRETDTNFL